MRIGQTTGDEKNCHKSLLFYILSPSFIFMYSSQWGEPIRGKPKAGTL